MIFVLDADKFLKEHKAIGPVTSPSFFFSGTSKNYHSQGLYSEDIFGLVGSNERRKSFSWIELNCPVIHPVLFDILEKRIERKIIKVLSGQKRFSLDSDGFLEENDNGNITGMSALAKNATKWHFRPGEDEDGDRNKIIDVMESYKSSGLFFMQKLVVISPEYRVITVEGNEVKMVNELSNLYRKIIVLSNQIKSVSGSLFDILAYNMQLLMRELYELVKGDVSKKNGIIRNLMLGKRVDFSARSVVSPDPFLKLGHVGVPFRIVVGLFEPNIIYGLVNSKYADDIPKEFHQAVKDFLGKEKSDEFIDLL